ncbi:hypothetical protein B0T22DRAFT_303489 [Podospora appendiculata]|uniref:Uncharacterized protein n=1 Tax=Podospora appendiculata TaxID=314037 RepID=A0AAE0WZT1_9PEZI|nr:hypothetical protein B0T22DRAFT_303489 [Podospora appendiculata]
MHASGKPDLVSLAVVSLHMIRPDGCLGLASPLPLNPFLATSTRPIKQLEHFESTIILINANLPPTSTWPVANQQKSLVEYHPRTRSMGFQCSPRAFSLINSQQADIPNPTLNPRPWLGEGINFNPPCHLPTQWLACHYRHRPTPISRHRAGSAVGLAGLIGEPASRGQEPTVRRAACRPFLGDSSMR